MRAVSCNYNGGNAGSSFILVNDFSEEDVDNKFGLCKVDATSLQVLSQHQPEEMGRIQTFCFKGEKLVYGTSGGDVVYLDFETLKGPMKLTRRGLGITCVDICDKFVFICNPGENFKIINMENKTATIEIPVDNALNYLAVDPSETKLAATDESGILSIYDISSLKIDGLHEGSEQAIKIIKTISEGEFFDIKVGPVWNPFLDLLAIVSEAGLNIYSSETWKSVKDFTESEGLEITCVKWSSDGRYLAISDAKTIFILDSKRNWEISQRLKPVDEDTMTITTFEWSLKSDRLFVANSKQAYSWIDSNVEPISDIDDGSASEIISSKSGKAMVIDEEAAIVKNEEKEEVDSELEGLDVADFESDGEISDEDDEDVTNDEEEIGDRESDTGIGSRSATFGISRHNSSAMDEGRLAIVMDRLSKLERNQRLERIFKVLHPCATPSLDDRQFLDCNTIGYMVLRHDTEALSMIDVEFHDIKRSRALRIVNEKGFTMGAMGEYGLILASPGDRGNSKSSIRFQRYDSSSSGRWEIEFGDGERVLGVACGTKYLFVATDRNTVYGFTVSGLQWFPVSFCGDYITMCTNDSLLFLVYALNGQMKCSLYEYEGMTLMGTCDIDFAGKETELIWVGFSSSQEPAIYTSDGKLRLLFANRGFIWVEMFRLSDTIYDGVWPLGFSEDDQLLAIELSRGCKYPNALQRPLMITLDLSVGLVSDGYDKMKTFLKGKLRDSSAEDEDDDSKIQTDHLLSELILIAIKSGELLKALDYCALLQMEKSLEVATKLAIHFNYPQLVSRINVLREKMFPEESEVQSTSYNSYAEKEDSEIVRESETKHVASDECTMISDEEKENDEIVGVPAKTTFAGFLDRNKGKGFEENNLAEDESDSTNDSIKNKRTKVNPFSIKARNE